MPPKIVVHGAQLRCTMGTASSTLSVVPGKNIQVDNQDAATVDDFQPLVNIAPFGNCISTANPQVAAANNAPQPCFPQVSAKWKKGGPTVLLTGPVSLTDDSTCQCKWAGLISVQDAGQPTVFIGRGGTMGGGVSMGGGGGKQQSRRQAAPGQSPAAQSGSGAGQGTAPTTKPEERPKNLICMEFEIVEPHGAPRVGAIVTLLDNGSPVGQQVVPASGFVTFDNLVEGDVYTLDIVDHERIEDCDPFDDECWLHPETDLPEGDDE